MTVVTSSQQFLWGKFLPVFIGQRVTSSCRAFNGSWKYELPISSAFIEVESYRYWLDLEADFCKNVHK